MLPPIHMNLTGGVLVWTPPPKKKKDPMSTAPLRPSGGNEAPGFPGGPGLPGPGLHAEGLRLQHVDAALLAKSQKRERVQLGPVLSGSHLATEPLSHLTG